MSVKLAYSWTLAELVNNFDEGPIKIIAISKHIQKELSENALVFQSAHFRRLFFFIQTNSDTKNKQSHRCLRRRDKLVSMSI